MSHNAQVVGVRHPYQATEAVLSQQDAGTAKHATRAFTHEEKLRLDANVTHHHYTCIACILPARSTALLLAAGCQ